MNSRSEKYEKISSNNYSRLDKNQELYKNINRSNISSFGVANNSTIIEGVPHKIDLDKIKNYINSLEEKPQSQRQIVNTNNAKEEPNEINEEEKVYDINSVLEQAKENRENYYENEKHRKIHDTQYDILNKIDLNHHEKEEEKYEFSEEEKSLIDLINTVTMNKTSLDLLSELKGKLGEETVEPMSNRNDPLPSNDIQESNLPINNASFDNEKNPSSNDSTNNSLVKEIDKSFYTNSMSFSKEDFDGFEELEKAVKKNNILVKLSIIILVIMGIVTIYVIIKYLF